MDWPLAKCVAPRSKVDLKCPAIECEEEPLGGSLRFRWPSGTTCVPSRFSVPAPLDFFSGKYVSQWRRRDFGDRLLGLGRTPMGERACQRPRNHAVWLFILLYILIAASTVFFKMSGIEKPRPKNKSCSSWGKATRESALRDARSKLGRSVVTRFFQKELGLVNEVRKKVTRQAGARPTDRPTNGRRRLKFTHPNRWEDQFRRRTKEGLSTCSSRRMSLIPRLFHCTLFVYTFTLFSILLLYCLRAFGCATLNRSPYHAMFTPIGVKVEQMHFPG